MLKKLEVERTGSAAPVCSEQQINECRIITDENTSTASSTLSLLHWPQKYKNFVDIFNFKNLGRRKSVSRNAKRMRAYWQSAKTINAIRYKNNDKRPYAEVRMLDRIVLGLMDTGAAISCVGGRLAEQLIRSRFNFKRIISSACTADGKKQEIVGRFKTAIKYKNETKDIELHIIPSLSQDLYLGIDFWTTFNLLPPDREISELSSDSHNLLGLQKESLQAVIDKFPSFVVSGLGKTSLISHIIDVGDAKPIKQRHFPISPAQEKLLYAEIDRMLEQGVIEESDSAWSSPVVLVQKPGKFRICLDSRKVNAVSRKDAYPLPQIDGILSRLPKAMFISSLDLKDAYWQIPLDVSSRDKTAFTIPGRPLYQYKVMPFGLTNAAATMTRLMDKVIPPSLRNEVFVYLDDLLIVSNSFESHLKVLTQVAERIKSAGLTLNVEKSKFCMRSVKYLGHIIGEGVIRTDPEKISAMTDFPIPRTLKALRSFLGMVGWYRKFISNFAAISAPLTDLLKPRQKFIMTPEGEQAFVKLKQLLCLAPVLRSPDFSKPFFIHCDASKTGVGGVLVQKTEDGDEYPIAFVSKKLNKAQKNYTVTEQECLAALVCIKRFRAYVEGHEFTVITDHASLKWLMSQQDLHSRLARWALKLQGFRFKIEHRSGRLNIVPDALSRVHDDEIAAIESSNGLLVDLESKFFKSDDYTELMERVKANADKLPDVKVVENFVYRRSDHATGDQLHDSFGWKLWIPKELVSEVLKNAHDHPLASHGGVHKTLERIRRYYYWPGLVNDVKCYINSCETCKTTKAPNTVQRPPIGKSPESQRFFQRLYIDFLGPYPRSRSGNIGIFIVMDHYTKFVFLKAVKKLTADVVVKYMQQELFHTFGVPETVVSDNGSQFKAEAFQKLLRDNQVVHTLTAVYSPQANASERVNRSIIAAIRSYIRPDQKDWDEHLSSISCALRSAVHSGIGATPYYMVFGQQFLNSGSTYKLLRHLKLLEDKAAVYSKEDSLELIRSKACEVMRKQNEKNERNYNLRSRAVSYRVGQEIYRRNFRQSNFQAGYNSKLGPAYIKARVRRKIGNCYYELEDLQGRFVGKYHAKDLKQ
ncbi:uncharacterized protein LOC115632467 isoform X1 [Scaptodrosophila lebanonensis]|uniref:RNA-directed DNA polymerase n=1 Tax=Drosophila lebanonensis TaxID=7225 RepID=A0A6J2UAV6_DROLE|nr:uncharacterized protein LOC115632467 isoform X1 [Scaptodrosophila lebanonensis]XP_030385489.1 uncharacterized protein LOC115632467 isoform X1 [Scaptodrosophila lebanonensis]